MFVNEVLVVEVRVVFVQVYLFGVKFDIVVLELELELFFVEVDMLVVYFIVLGYVFWNNLVKGFWFV